MKGGLAASMGKTIAGGLINCYRGMMRNKILYNALLIGFMVSACILFLCARHVTADDRIAVHYQYEGQSHIVYSEKIGPNTFIFNKGAGKIIKITTLDWAPYIGRDICRQGWVQQLTIALLSSQGYEIICTFYPWARTISLAEMGNVDILYPEYFIEPEAPSDVYAGTKRRDHLAISKKIPGGPIAFMKRKGAKDNYNGDLKNLGGASIGVVRGYQNTPEFDRLMDQKFFNVYGTTDDFSNVKMLVANRVDLIIGDPAVIFFCISHSNLAAAEKKRIIDGIEIVYPLIQYNHLYYAVSKKRPNWKDTLELLNRTISEFEENKEVIRIIERTNNACGFVMETMESYKQ